jgi:recombinational DNA repair ATPase RecF
MAEIIWLMGAPGSGKGTNTPFILEARYLFTHARAHTHKAERNLFAVRQGRWPVAGGYYCYYSECRMRWGTSLTSRFQWR